MSSIQATLKDKHLTIAITGRFTFSLYRDFAAAYKQVAETPTSVDVDLSAVDYMDSAALGMLLSMQNHYEDCKKLTLSHATGTVRKILEIARFDKTFQII